MALDDATRKFIAQAVAEGIKSHFAGDHTDPETMEDDDEEKMEEEEDMKAKSSRRSASAELVKLRRQNERLREESTIHAQELAALRNEHRTDRFTRVLRDMRDREGFRFADFEETLQRVISAKDPDAELHYIRHHFAQDPIGTRISMEGARAPSGSGGPSQADHERAAAHARKKCLQDGDSKKFSTYYDEALKTG